MFHNLCDLSPFEASENMWGHFRSSEWIKGMNLHIVGSDQRCEYSVGIPENPIKNWFAQDAIDTWTEKYNNIDNSYAAKLIGTSLIYLLPSRTQPIT